MTQGQGVAVTRTVAVLAVALLIGLVTAVGVLYTRLPSAAAPSLPLPSPEAPVTAEPVSGRFTDMPYACGLLTKSQFGKLARNPYSRRDGRGGCEWDAVEIAKDHTKGIVIKLRLLANEARAHEYLEALRAEAATPSSGLELGDKKQANGPLTSPVPGLGDEAYAAQGDMGNARPGFSRRTVVRLSNLVVLVDYRLYGASDDRDGRLERGSLQAATWAVQALERLG